MSTTQTVMPERSPSSRRERRRRLGWTWFAGADERVLALVPSERSFLDAQGLVIVAMARVTGFAVAVAGSGWWNVPITHLLWLGLVWTVVICIVDRLIYKSFGTSRDANLALAVPRAALSVMLALVLGLPMVQFIFKPSISNQLSQSIAVEQKDARKAAISFYEPKIKEANAQIAAIEDQRDDAAESRRASSRVCRAARTTTRRARTRISPGAGTGAATTRVRRAARARPSTAKRPSTRGRSPG